MCAKPVAGVKDDNSLKKIVFASPNCPDGYTSCGSTDDKNSTCIKLDGTNINDLKLRECPITKISFTKPTLTNGQDLTGYCDSVQNSTTLCRPFDIETVMILTKSPEHGAPLSHFRVERTTVQLPIPAVGKVIKQGLEVPSQRDLSLIHI